MTDTTPGAVRTASFALDEAAWSAPLAPLYPMPAFASHPGRAQSQRDEGHAPASRITQPLDRGHPMTDTTPLTGEELAAIKERAERAAVDFPADV